MWTIWVVFISQKPLNLINVHNPRPNHSLNPNPRQGEHLSKEEECSVADLKDVGVDPEAGPPPGHWAMMPWLSIV